MRFVLVHGFLNTHRRLTPLRRHLEDHGHACLVPSLTPNHGGKGLAYLAGQLAETISLQIPDHGEKFALLGFSMGGLVARHYLQALGGDQRASHFFSLATPHQGSAWAYFPLTLGVKEMRPGSAFLQGLAASETKLEGIACYSYWTPFDLMILPPTSSIWSPAENIRVRVPTHPQMVRNRWLMDDILAKVPEG